ncbi:hypothetical protein ABEO76_24305 [Bacillus anthracis]
MNNNQEGTEQSEPFTTETFLLLCYKTGLSRADLDDMTIGMCLDYIDAYIDMQNPEKNKEKERKASQEDFNNF